MPFGACLTAYFGSDRVKTVAGFTLRYDMDESERGGVVRVVANEGAGTGV